MVSLINFRTFSELAPETNTTFDTNNHQSHHNHQNQTHQHEQHSNSNQNEQNQNNTFTQDENNLENQERMKKYNLHQTIGHPLQNKNSFLSNTNNNNQQAAAIISEKPHQASRNHFEIRWSNLTYQVEPKWYQRLQLTSSSITSSAQQQQQLQQQQQVVKKNILNNLNGSVKSGQVTAILGPSGAGKTSLLGCLTGKNKSGVSGSVQVISNYLENNNLVIAHNNNNNNDNNQKNLLLSTKATSLTSTSTTTTNTSQQSIVDEEPPMQICTIPQKDYLLNQLTVRENLWFASRLKHPEDNFDHDSNIDRVVDLLKLDTCIDTKISKISGGQYKRVSIAQELLSNPDILILDEPTSGLDSLTCYKTVMVLRDLARLSPNPMAIIVTIHQPQREVFELFNHVYILAIGGRCIYEGQPSQSIKTINKYSGGLHFDADQYNPASYLVEIASSEFGEKPIEALVEHQRRDFKRKVLEQVMNSAAQAAGGGVAGATAAADGSQQQQHQLAAAIAASLTPNLKKKSHSPMVARFKSTLSSLTGSSSSSSAAAAAAASNNFSSSASSPLTSRKFKLPKQQFAAYTNEAYDHATSNQEATNVTITDADVKNQAPNYFDVALDSNNRLKQLTNINGNNENNNNNNNFNSNNSLIYQYASDQFDNHSNNSRDSANNHEFYLDERLQTHKHNHKGHFLRHCRLLTKRSWLCLCKDPMLTTLRFSAHIIVPLLITIVYGNRVGKPNACPLYETNMDLIDYARSGAKRLLTLQDELRCTFENVGLYFLSIYAFTFSTMCLTSLSFPLNMHVLLKEVRNGWYSIPTYFIGKTIADFPLEFILPTLTLMITYPLTGQPSSYMEWRFLLATGIFVVTSLIAQTQGLIFGALFMNAMQAAVFVAPVSTTPLILLSGFLIRISQMPIYLQRLSSLSYFRYAIESLTIIRYGFGQCPCDPSVVTGKPVSAVGVPDQLRTMTNYWLSTFDSDNINNNNNGEYSLNDTITDLITTTIAPTINETIATTTEQPQVDFFQDLTVLLARANSFGADIKTCDDLKPYPMIDFTLEDKQLYIWVVALIATLFVSKIVNYIVVKYSVKWRL